MDALLRDAKGKIDVVRKRYNADLVNCGELLVRMIDAYNADSTADAMIELINNVEHGQRNEVTNMILDLAIACCAIFATEAIDNIHVGESKRAAERN